MADHTESDTEPNIRDVSHEMTQDDSSPTNVPVEEFPFVFFKHRTSEHSVKVYFKPRMSPQVAGRDPNCDIFLGDDRQISWNHFVVLSLGSGFHIIDASKRGTVLIRTRKTKEV